MKVPVSYYSPEDIEKAKDAINDVLTTGQGMTEISLICKNGRRVPFEYVVSAVKGEDNKMKYLISIGRDISERRRAEEERKQLLNELAAKNRELEQIIYVTSHDLRSPLTNIDGFSREFDKFLKELSTIFQKEDISAETKEKVRQIIEKDAPESIHFIKSSLYKMESLLNGLLKLSRVGKTELDVQNLDMNMLMSNVIRTFKYRIKETGTKLEISELPSCEGDEVQINQLFSNLIDNALKYLDPEKTGMIRISGHEEKEESVYRIEDNGIGIPPEHLDKIFKIFNRLDPSSSSGEGLGLAIVQKIVNIHRGKIQVESESGKGSTFSVSLPRQTLDLS